MKFERKEALLRILIGIVSGILLAVWRYLVVVLVVIHWFVAIFTAKRNKEIAEFTEIWNTQAYVYLRYITFVSNKRPFPFRPLDKNLSKFGK